MMPVRYLAAGAALLALGLGFFRTAADARPAAEDKAPPQLTQQLVAPDDVAALIKAETEVIKKALEKGDKKSQTKARVSAMLVALYAQSAKKFGVRDQAL